MTVAEAQIKALKALCLETEKKVGLYTKEIAGRNKEKEVLGKYDLLLAGESERPVLPKVVEKEEPQNTPVNSKEIDNAREMVLQLANAGFSNDIIASKTGLAIGEIELIKYIAAERLAENLD
jgi:hypothetical protein